MYRKLSIFVLLSLVAPFAAQSAQEHSSAQNQRQEDRHRSIKPNNRIDNLVFAELNGSQIKPSNLSSDDVFIRRIYLDVIGTLPKPNEVRKFLADRNPKKRAILIDQLLQRDEFADYWSMKWCDLLRVKAEFPINLWPNAVQAYHRWIHDCLRDNMPYDKFAGALLTSSGSNFRTPQVNFYRAIQGREPAAITNAVALTFMGTRIEKWPEDRRYGIQTLFSRVAYKNTAEWKEEIVYFNPVPDKSLKTVLPDGIHVQIQPDADPRKVFADWLIKPDNQWFARNIVNRIWSWLMGRGIIHEPDDIRPDNPPVHPKLLAYLESELIESGYNLRHIYRLILNSHTYQQSSIPRSDNPKAEELFACYPVRQLEAEVLIDAICWITGTHESYSSPIPEPYTFIPDENRSIELADGSITSGFLEMFGRPPRDTGLESERNNQPTDAQRLHMLNSTHIQNKIERSRRLAALIKYNRKRKNRRRLINVIYINILSRFPTKAELATVEEYFQSSKMNTRQAVNDLVWALMNTKEFLYRH